MVQLSKTFGRTILVSLNKPKPKRQKTDINYDQGPEVFRDFNDYNDLAPPKDLNYSLSLSYPSFS